MADTDTGGGLRFMMRFLAHRPFQGEFAQRFLWLLGLGPDGVLEKLNQGIHNRFIFQANTGALARIGGDRGIVHGLTESDESYAARVGRAIDDWQRAGSAWSVMSQVLGYVLAKTPSCLCVSSVYSAGGVVFSSQWDFYEVAADPTKAPDHTLDTVGNWDWDSLSPTTGSWISLAWYLVINAANPQNWIDSADLWATGGLWGSSGDAWGVAASNLVGLSVKVIVAQWKPTGPRMDWIIISFSDGGIFQRDQPAGGGVNPDGYFGRWSKLSGGVYVRSRFSDARYFRGPT